MVSQLRGWRLLALACHTVLLNPAMYNGAISESATVTDLTPFVLNFLLTKEEELTKEMGSYTAAINGTGACACAVAGATCR
jgi:hypothetical protein